MCIHTHTYLYVSFVVSFDRLCGRTKSLRVGLFPKKLLVSFRVCVSLLTNMCMCLLTKHAGGDKISESRSLYESLLQVSFRVCVSLLTNMCTCLLTNMRGPTKSLRVGLCVAVCGEDTISVYICSRSL